MRCPDCQQVHNAATSNPNHVTIPNYFFGNVIGHGEECQVVDVAVQFSQCAVHEREIAWVIACCCHDQRDTWALKPG